MASSSSSSSSSSSALRWKYEVFINFRGEDTRRVFVSHLYRALRQKPINTFIDAEDLGKGDRISELLTAIRESRISIVVFSQNYASSTWCLKELVQILECKDKDNQIVLPIFYQVDPSDVRKHKRSFAEAFAHYSRDSNTQMEEVQSWISALTTATSLSGWDSRNFGDDAVLIENIVEDVFRKLIQISSTSRKDNGLVGMNSHMHNMHLRLQLAAPGVELDDVRVVGIWGMGGLGKTTIAGAVYAEIACRFEASCFLENVKEGFMRHGKQRMQTELLSSISANKVRSSDISNKGFEVMLKSLGQRKVLIVLDDVDKLEQIEALLGKQNSFGGGSRIIITTRDLELLGGADAMYNPKILSDPGALELFRWYAFRKNKPTTDYDDLSSCAVNYAQGLPLALKVLGSLLDNKTVREWEDFLEKLKKFPPKGINDVLKTSIDGLDRTEKNIFLDIACFFKGMNKDYAIEVLDSCDFHPHIGMKVLIDRALITVSVNGKLEMHDLLEEMGREIVRQESSEEPGRRSRLWSYEDVHLVLTQNKATKVVESVILDLSNSYEVCLNAEAFVSMTQLRLLKISHSKFWKYDYCKQRLIGHFKFLSRELRCLTWRGFPLKSLSSNFQFKNLVDLDMQYSLIEQLWEGTPTLEKLKFINLSYCRYLKETPDFTKVPNIAKLILQSCTSLVEVHPSISTLANLVLLDLNGCRELKILASSIRMQSLETLDLSGCSSLEMFPEILEVMGKLPKLNLSGLKIKKLPLSINNLTGLHYLNLRDCKELKSLPSNICMKSLKTLNLSGCSSLEMFPAICTRSLETLDLSGCSSLEMFPEILEVMGKLLELNLSGLKIKKLPLSINNLTGLCYLNLRDCKELKSLPSDICMKSLKTLDLSGCSSLEMFPAICTRSLETLDLSGCSSLEMFPEILEVMGKLLELNLSGLKIKKLPLSINNLTGLCYLNLRDCKELKSLPSDICMKSLKTLDLSGCSSLEMFPAICTRSLETLDLSGCSSLEMFPEILEVMGKLLELNLSGLKIKKLPLSINNLTGLCYLNLRDCKELKSLPSDICMKSLKTLDLSGCSSLEMFPAICTRSLETLDLSGCSSLEMFPEILEVMGKLLELNLSGLKIKKLPLSINNLTGLCYLNLRDCKELKSLPSSICQFKSLTCVTLSGCTKFGVFPNIVENMEGLRELHLDRTSIKELSPSIERLQGLEYLNLRNCKSLVHLPDTLCNLPRLLALNLCGCPNLSQLPVNLVRLQDNGVELDGCHTDILTRVQHSQTTSASTTELRHESLTRKQLSQTSSTSSKYNGLVEMDSHVHEMHLLLHPPGVETNDVRVVGIWGMGGIGKTTVARTVYDEIACQFEACCFLHNVKEGFMKHGKLHMQKLLLSILGNKVGSSDILDKGFQELLKRLGQRKVLLVVDDVDNLAQIEALLGEQHSFGGGSKIIITTRDLQLLSGADAIYRPEFLSDRGALELLRQYAFRTNQPTSDYDDLLRRAVKYAQGLPLELKVLGAFLYNKTVREWEDALDKVSIIPQRLIRDVLKTSFDGLDYTEKNIFLDIACFFKGMRKDYVIEILAGCGFYPHIGIRVLIDRALIAVSEEGELEMHDLLEKMGREIVRQESFREPGLRSRLWSYEDVHHVLTQNTATEAVESIILDLSNSDVRFINTNAFACMTRLRLLKISHKYYMCKDFYFVIQHLIGHFKFLSDELRCLSWIGFPLKSLPSNFRFKNLIDLDMQYSLIDRLWEGTQTLEKLKFINLSYCQFLKETPDFTKVPNLEQLILQNCMSLIEVHPSISTLTNLVLLNLNGCKKLKILASSIRMKSLKTLDLSGCLSLEMFPDILEVMEKLSELNLSRSKIKELPSSINNLTGLCYLDLRDCKELKSLPNNICQLKSLTYVTLSGCTKIEVFPNIVENMEGLRELHLDGTSIKELSPSIELLQGLEYLNLRNCKSLVHLPDTLCNLAHLLALNLCGCQNLSQLPVNLVRLWDNATEIDNWHTEILTRVQHSQTTSTSTTELRHESLTRKQLSQTSSTSSEDNGLVEMDSHMHEMHLLLHPPGVETNDVRVVGIWGMGGIGKTTVARTVYDEIACQFEACCFLENVKEGFMKHGKLHMQKQLLSSILGNMVGSSDILDKGFQELLKRLGQRKVLLVVDDVDNLAQIEALLGEQHSFGGGSKIIITTRDLQLLSGADAIYRPEFLSDRGALELLRRYAFRTNQPTSDYDDLLRRAVKYAQGLPLELKVLGAFLDNKTVREWEDVLDKVSIIPQRGIHDVLKTSFDGLDYTEKNIFLDIACFFKGMKKDHAIEILDNRGFCPHTGVRVLIDQALISVSGEGALEMHDSLEKMGREIVRQESFREPGVRSRLWSYEDVHHVLTQNTGTEAIESIILDLSGLHEVWLNAESFDRMTGLRLLKISCPFYNLRLIGNLRFLSHKLRCLSWLGFPLKSLPSNCQFKNLVDLDMRYSLIDRLWEGTLMLEKLKFIDLSYSQYLKETPDFTKVPNLEKLILQSCMSLIEVHPSIETHTNLVLLNLNGCQELKILASSIRIKSLKTLYLSGCTSLEMFPEISEVMKELSVLNLSGSKIKELPSSINNLTGLSYLDLKVCKELKSLPSNICQLKSLTYLTLSGCTKFEVFPSIEENMERLRELHLDGTSIRELSPSIERLQGLVILNLRDCKSLVDLPDTLCNLERLGDLNLCGCPNLSQLHVNFDIGHTDIFLVNPKLIVCYFIFSVIILVASLGVIKF